MKKVFKRMVSLLLTIIMVINLLPLGIFAEEVKSASQIGQTSSKPAEEPTRIVEEVPAKRTEFSKEFKLNNGLHMAAVYPEAVHFETEDGLWEDIDNTLILSGSGANAVYTNTAGVWDVSFPRSLSSTKRVSITKDGYTLAFNMAGQLRRDPNAEIMSVGTATASAAAGNTAETFAVNSASVSTAQIQAVDLSAMIADMEYPEIVSSKLNSRLAYNNLFSGTDVVYDLSSNKVKESIVMDAYDADLRGFRYTLDVGTLIPVLGEDGHIDLYDTDRKEIVMVMPAPYMVDNAGEVSRDVTVTLVPNGTSYTLNYLIPIDWLADTDRSWPVVLDPVVQADIDINNISDATVSSIGTRSYTEDIIETGVSETNGISRCYLAYDELPALTSADVIVAAEISLYKPSISAASSIPDAIEVHKVLTTWQSNTITWNKKPGYNTTVEDYAIVSAQGRYSWDVTDIARDWYTGNNTGMMFKSPNSVENAGDPNYKEFRSSDTYNDSVKPILWIVFRNNNGLESYWDYTAASAGRAGTGYINNYTGNLVWVRNDIGFGGNRMPVSISHIYNANDSSKNDFGLGYGWRTNYNQRVYTEGDEDEYYVWEDGDGTKHYFQFDSANTYKDEDGLELTLKTNGSGTSKYSITDKYGNVSFFDTQGRLTKMSNNQTTQSHITINYLEANNPRISTITDGAGRVYIFTYPSSSGLLSEISYTGTDTKEDAYVNFEYNSSNLTEITDKDGKNTTFEYTTKNLLSSATDVDGYKLDYTYTQTASSGNPSRVKIVKETSGGVTGGELSIEYAHNQTTFKDHNDNVQIVQFNNWGNTVSIQDGEGRAQFAQYANNGTSGSNEGKGNQLMLSSKLQNTVGNMLDNSSFESATTWTGTATTVTCTPSSEAAYLGSKSLKLTRSSVGTAAGAYTVFSAEANQTYTFSAYVKTGAGSAYLAMVDGTTSVSSQVLPANSDWTRLEVSYTASTAKNVGVRLMTADAGTVYMDCVQVEKAPTASRYNMVQNGDFRLGTFWSSNNGNVEVEADHKAPAVQLDKKVYTITGSPTTKKRISQTVQVSGSKDDTFVLAGWAKGDSAPLPVAGAGENQRQFAIIGTFNYTDGTKGEFIAQFNPDTDSTVNWQYSATAMVAAKAYNSIKLELAYDYNVNTVYFDGIQLYKEEFGNSYLYDNEGNVTSVVDLQKKQTTYEYDTNNNLTGVFQDNKPKMTYEYFTGTHNVKNATTGEGLVYEFKYDDYGNNKSVSITSGNLKLESKATYSNNGNTLETTTDAAGKVTTYHYNADTNVLEWVQYPEDTPDTRTEYTYDSMYRLASAEATTDQGSALTASYTYENDLLKKIETASTTYNFSYGNFALRSSIKVGSRELANYTYTSRNNYLDTLEYGNNDSVKYTYDNQGRVTKQTYEDGDTVTYTYDNSGALATVTDSATGRTTTYYYDFTDRLMKYVEKGTGYTHSVGYEYDDINNLTALVDTINGVKHTTSYAYDDDNRVTSVTADKASRTYGYDGFSRINSRVTKHNGSTLLTDTLTYRNPTSTTTSGQIWKQQTTSDEYDVLRTYTYDDNGNILSVSDGGHTSSYVYDTANQLIRENNQKLGKTWVWEYDNAGNIKSRKEYAYTTGSLGEVLDTITYTYGNSNWGDLLTAYNGNTITHDEIGNPLDDGTWTYTWEHGRELMSMYGEDIGGEANDVTISYEYDADGMRTKKIVTTNHYHVHDYTAVVTPPTCTEGGYTTHTCDCGDSYTDTETEATGHTMVPSRTEPTCTGTGEYRETCACGYETVEILPALGHTYEDQTTVDPETGASVTQTVCTRCDYVWADHVHDNNQTVVAPTCTEGGWTIFTCAACGVSYEGDYTRPLGHGYLEEVVHGLAIQSASSKLQCVRCDESIQLERHFFIITNNAGAPTCTEHGYSLCECDCGYSYHMEAGSATGHNYTSAVVAPTEDSYGYTLYTCSACGDSYKDNFVNHEHSYTESTVVAATCIEGGYTLHECECGHSYQDAETDYIGHEIVQGKDPATRMPCYECTRCDFSYTLKHTQTYSLRGRSQRILESTTVEEYSYVYTGGNLMQMVLKTTTTPAGGTATTTTETLNFTYDASGTPMSVKYGNTTYYYVVNIQGDIMAILNTSGEPVVQYNYDAWGKLHSFFGSMEDTLGEVNPLTYRGYVYDHDSGYYYLQSRYYDPEIGRFINADSVTSTGCGLLGMNMFAYCNNSPVVYTDDSGCAPWPTTKVMSDCYSLPIFASTDGNEGSDELLAYLIDNNQIPKSDSIVNITVQKVDNHIETDDAWLNLIVTHVEMFAGDIATAIQPCRPELAAIINGVGKVLGTIGYLQVWYDAVSKPLSPGDYDQYKVVMSWSNTEQINGIYCTTYYTETSYYLSWESNLYDNSPWYLHSYVRDFDVVYYP